MWPIARDLASVWAEDQGGVLSQISMIADKTLAFGLRLPELLDRAEHILHQMESQKPAEKTTSPVVWVLLGAGITTAIAAIILI